MLDFWAKVMSLTDFEIKTRKGLIISLVVFCLAVLIAVIIFPKQEFVGVNF